MRQYRFINSKTEEVALIDGALVERSIVNRSLTSEWEVVIDELCLLLGWNSDDLLAVSNDGLFAWQIRGQIRVSIDFIGRDIESHARRYHSMLWR